MGVTNFGNQTISIDFKEEGVSRKFNRLNYQLHEKGIYSGFTLTRTSANTISISAGTCFIEDSTIGVGNRISTSQAVSLTTDYNTPYLVFKWGWVDGETNYMDMVFDTEANILANPSWVVVAKINFTGSDIATTNSFDYSKRDVIHRQKNFSDTVSVHGVTMGHGGGLNADSVDNCHVDTSDTLGTNDDLHFSTTKRVRTFITNYFENTIKPWVNSTIASFYPIGTIWMFDGTNWQDNVTLVGWYACVPANSSKGAPNLIDKFIKGGNIGTKGVDYGVNGGSSTHTLTTAELPPHIHNITHTHNASATPLAVPHTHTVNVNPHSHATLFYDRMGSSAVGSKDPNNDHNRLVETDNPVIVRREGFIENTTVQVSLENADIEFSTNVTITDFTGNSGNGGFANTAIDLNPSHYSVIYIRKCE